MSDFVLLSLKEEKMMGRKRLQQHSGTLKTATNGKSRTCSLFTLGGTGANGLSVRQEGQLKPKASFP